MGAMSPRVVFVESKHDDMHGVELKHDDIESNSSDAYDAYAMSMPMHAPSEDIEPPSVPFVPFVHDEYYLSSSSSDLS